MICSFLYQCRDIVVLLLLAGGRLPKLQFENRGNLKAPRQIQSEMLKMRSLEVIPVELVLFYLGKKEKWKIETAEREFGIRICRLPKEMEARGFVSEDSLFIIML